LALVMLIGSIPLGFSEPLRVQLEQGIETGQLQCDNPKHVLVQRTNGNVVCVTEKSAERMGWEIIENILVVNDQTESSSEKLHIESVPSDSTGSHSSSGGIPNPNFTFDIPTEIAIGETVSIDYTIDWNDENGDPLYQKRVKNGYMEDVVIVPVLYLPDEIQVVSDDFELVGALGTIHNNHMQGKYYGEGILYDNTKVFEGSIQIKLSESMLYENDDIHIALYRASDVFSFQTVSTDDGIFIVTQSDPRSDGMRQHTGIEGRYLQMFGFDDEDQKWHGNRDKVYEIDSNGFPKL